ncbi:MAG: ribbon-helix-helix domain-containing protein [archaeon]|nr:ribbon-helix-helix domain-containing protein [archaeon]
MKTRVSITIDEEKIEKIDEVLKKGLFRNKSHVMEYALIKFLEGEEIK